MLERFPEALHPPARRAPEIHHVVGARHSFHCVARVAGWTARCLQPVDSTFDGLRRVQPSVAAIAAGDPHSTHAYTGGGTSGRINPARQGGRITDDLRCSLPHNGLQLLCRRVWVMADRQAAAYRQAEAILADIEGGNRVTAGVNHDAIVKAIAADLHRDMTTARPVGAPLQDEPQRQLPL